MSLNKRTYIPIFAKVLFLGSPTALRKAASSGGYSSALGTTDLGLPKIVIEYD